MTTQNTTATVQAPVTMTEAERIESDIALLRWKQSGGPARDNQARAEKLDRQWGPAMRLAGWQL